MIMVVMAFISMVVVVLNSLQIYSGYRLVHQGYIFCFDIALVQSKRLFIRQAQVFEEEVR